MLPHRRIQGAYLIRPLLGVRKKISWRILNVTGSGTVRIRPIGRTYSCVTGSGLNCCRFWRSDTIPASGGPCRTWPIPLAWIMIIWKSRQKDLRANGKTRTSSSSSSSSSKKKKKKKNSNAVRFNRAAFTRQPEAVKRMLIRLALERLQGNMNRLTLAHMRTIEGALSQTAVDSLVHLPGHLRVRVGKTGLEITRSGNSSQQKT